MRVLVVEDYQPLRRSLVTTLREEGYSVDEADNGELALALASSENFDVVVLDIMLPRLSGFEVLESCRQQGVKSCVLLLTARDEVSDRVRGLDLGADDYLVKPFAVEELLARVRALVRRNYQQRDPLIQVGHLQINTSSHEVWVDDTLVDLTAKEYALLEYLVVRAGEVVSRSDIWDHIYDDRSEATSNVVDVYIGYLRKKIELEGHERIIQTKRGEGYFVNATMRSTPE